MAAATLELLDGDDTGVLAWATLELLDGDDNGELEGGEAGEEVGRAAEEGVSVAVTGQTVTDTALVDVTITTSV